MKGVKVVYSFGGRLESCSMILRGNVVYAPGKKTFPEKGCGPLFVYDTVENAINQAKLLDPANFSLQSWTCEYEPSTETTGWTSNGAILEKDSFPRGTRLASCVTLLERIG